MAVKGRERTSAVLSFVTLIGFGVIFFFAERGFDSPMICHMCSLFSDLTRFVTGCSHLSAKTILVQLAPAHRFNRRGSSSP